jgi:hypothetical protein
MGLEGHGWSGIVLQTVFRGDPLCDSSGMARVRGLLSMLIGITSTEIKIIDAPK